MSISLSWRRFAPGAAVLLLLSLLACAPRLHAVRADVTGSAGMAFFSYDVEGTRYIVTARGLGSIRETGNSIRTWVLPMPPQHIITTLYAGEKEDLGDDRLFAYEISGPAAPSIVVVRLVGLTGRQRWIRTIQSPGLSGMEVRGKSLLIRFAPDGQAYFDINNGETVEPPRPPETDIRKVLSEPLGGVGIITILPRER